MNNPLRPIHLDGYDVFGKLKEWANVTTPYTPGRHWQISMFGKKAVTCRLSWRFGDGQLGNLDHTATSPEEATAEALREFEKVDKHLRDVEKRYA